MMAEENEKIDLSKRTQKELIVDTYKELQSLTKSFDKYEKVTDAKMTDHDNRIANLELINERNAGLRQGVSLLVTVLSGISLALGIVALILNLL